MSTELDRVDLNLRTVERIIEGNGVGPQQRAGDYRSGDHELLIEALREARALLESGQDERLPVGLLAYNNACVALLAKWKGDNGEA